jgi:predicted dehydrogenase
MTLRAVVIGAGWAGEGHTRALQACGVEVVAICARQADVTQAVANRLGIPSASTDWRQTLETVKPEIVVLATPAALRGEVIEMATALGCHLLSEKPLATSAGEASRFYTLAEQAGIKHAYAATHCYDPGVAWLAELLYNKTIGTLHEIEVLARFQSITDLTPWFWWDSLHSGGGTLNAGLTHVLGMLETIIGREVVKVTGEARVLRRRAPIVPALHDYRQRGAATLTPAEAANLEWRACDADNAFSALLHFAAATPNTPTVGVYINVNMMAGHNAPTNGWYFYGAQGMLIAEGLRALTVFRHNDASAQREPLPAPSRLVAALPQIGDDVQNKWAALARDFVADIRGEPHRLYLTFRDGWRYQETIDAIRRAGQGWYEVPNSH